MNEKYEVIITTISNSAKKKITTISKEMYFSQTGECDKLEKKKGGKSQVRQKKFKRREVRV